jgi:hypothetical protein
MEQEVFERMLKEFDELYQRVNDCRKFLLDEERSKVLDALNKDLLITQLKQMEAYLSILSIRIGLNTPKEATTGFMQVADTVIDGPIESMSASTIE